MELALNNGFCEMTQSEMDLIIGGGWDEFGYALVGTLCIAASPIALATGQGWGAVALVGVGLSCYGNL